MFLDCCADVERFAINLKWAMFKDFLSCRIAPFLGLFEAIKLFFIPSCSLCVPLLSVRQHMYMLEPVQLNEYNAIYKYPNFICTSALIV
jgi:hypothetical protein